MIQSWIRETLSNVVPSLEWTYDYKTANDHSGVVYHEASGEDTRDDFDIMFPTYQVEIETSDLLNVEVYAWKIHEAMNKRRGDIVTTSGGVEFDLIFIEAVAPLPLGITGKRMTYTINLTATVRKRSSVLN